MRMTNLAAAALGDSPFRRDVIAGLSAARKSVPAKYFYDAEGSRLFEAICELAEYYPTRTEIALLSSVAPEIARHIRPGAALVEFGSGASIKTRLVLDAAPHLGAYVPLDISESALSQAARAIADDYPDLRVIPIAGDFTKMMTLPESIRVRPVVGFFPGSTIGNFTPAEAAHLLARSRGLLGEGSSFLIGVDLVKPVATLLAAYDDRLGVTAAFNKNLLVRINRELEGDFDLAAFEHRAVWNAEESRIEMHLVSKRAQRVAIGDEIFDFAAGETIHTENSYKFTPRMIADIAARGGWRVETSWVSGAQPFATLLLRTA
jgi:dimethylhistidine N-methyltransferase